VTQPYPAPAADTRRARLRYIRGLDGLRAVSVLAVLVYHHYVVGGTSPGWLPGGFYGVEVFFVVSGYLITSLLLDERTRTGTVKLKEFWFRRARRLLPALFLMLGVVIAYSLLFLRDSALAELKSDVIAAVTYTSNWWQIIADRSYFESAGRPELLRHLWSLAIEEQFYLFWPLIIGIALKRVRSKRAPWIMVGVALLSALAMALLYTWGVKDTYLYYATPTRLSGILLGSALAFFWTPRRIRGATGRHARIVLDAGGVLGLSLLWWSFRGTHDYDAIAFRGGFLLVDIASLLVIAAIVHPRSDMNRLLGFPVLVWIGLRSYGIYLWHFPIFAVTRPSDLESTFGITPPGWLWFALRLALTIGIATLSYRYVEVPIRSGAIRRYVERVRVERGAGRRRLATRGFAVAAGISLLAVGIGTGLANAQPEQSKIHGIRDQAAEEKIDPDVPRSEALAALQRALTSTTVGPTVSTTTTTATRVATTVSPVAAPTTVATTPPATTPPPPAAAPPQGVIGIGDSVMLGAGGTLQRTIPGMVVDAVVSRQFSNATATLQSYRDQNLLPPIIVVHLGTNGRFDDAEFDTMMQVIGPDRQAYFLTARVPRPWEAEVNDRLEAGVSRHTNAHLIDWHQYAGCHNDWFAEDGFHVTAVGATEYSRLVLAQITGQAAGLRYC
jgi:peptidoglycan/LPS O-acetylase OafA/YrhL